MLNFPAPVTSLIERRFSCRTYRKEPINAEKRKQLQAFIDALPDGPFASKPRFRLLAATETDSTSLRGLGTYGFIKDPPAFIVGALSPARFDLEDFGYLMETIILFATGLELGTCWLGGTFTKSSFAKRMHLSPTESIPAAASVGELIEQTQTRRGWASRTAGSHSRLSWEKLFFKDTFGTPLPQDETEGHALPLEMVRLGPSASNKQPWRIVKHKSSWRFYLRRTPGYREDWIKRALGLCDLQRLDMGIAMCHFELTARESGLPGRWVVEDQLDKMPDERTEYVISWRDQDGL
ncbi:MAG: nitroreductase family protein [Anaerolineales bacterium]